MLPDVRAVVLTQTGHPMVAARERYGGALISPLDVTPLFGAAGPDRDRVDAAIGAAVSTLGLLVISGRSDLLPCDGAMRGKLLRVFALAPEQQRALWRHTYAPENDAIYRGWSPRAGDVTVDIYDLPVTIQNWRRRSRRRCHRGMAESVEGAQQLA
jgi:hypothetical protein